LRIQGGHLLQVLEILEVTALATITHNGLGFGGRNLQGGFEIFRCSLIDIDLPTGLEVRGEVLHDRRALFARDVGFLLKHLDDLELPLFTSPLLAHRSAQIVAKGAHADEGIFTRTGGEIRRRVRLPAGNTRATQDG